MSIFDAFLEGPMGGFIESPLGVRDAVRALQCADIPDWENTGQCCIEAFGVNECIDSLTIDQCIAMDGTWGDGPCINRSLCTQTINEIDSGACCVTCDVGATIGEASNLVYNSGGRCNSRLQRECNEVSGQFCLQAMLTTFPPHVAGDLSFVPGVSVSRWYGRGTRCVDSVCMNLSGKIFLQANPNAIGIPRGFSLYAKDAPLALRKGCCVERRNYQGGTDSRFSCGGFYFAEENPSFPSSSLVPANVMCEIGTGFFGDPDIRTFIGPSGKLCTENFFELANFDYFFGCGSSMELGSCCFDNHCIAATFAPACRGMGGRLISQSTECPPDACPPPCCVSRNVCINNLERSRCGAIGGFAGEEFGRCELDDFG